jgi:L-ascorbate 6-phosphate lactonase
LTPYDAFRIGKALNAKVLIPDHYENWACTYLEPDELEEITKRNDPNMKTVILKTGALFVYPDDKDMGRYKYPDWQERFDWRKARYTLENE